MSNAPVDLERELAVARGAVRAAAVLSRAVHGKLGAAALQKDDRSPVTVADFASQAIVGATLREQSSITALVGEETAAELRGEAAAAVRAEVVAQLRSLRGAGVDAAEVLAWIDVGAFDPSRASTYWTLDPIDGTKGFLRGEQYAIALALIHEGQVLLGVLACPRLPARRNANANASDDGDGASAEGVLFTAVRGGGTFAYSLDAAEGAPGAPVRVDAASAASAARICESVEAGHSDHEVAARIAARLGIVMPPLRLDSQAKYATVARGEASIYLRLPTRQDYREKIWDHAAGLIVVEEAGGRVTDVRGAPLDFSHGRRLEANAGVIATNGQLHDRVLDAVAGALGA